MEKMTSLFFRGNPAGLLGLGVPLLYLLFQFFWAAAFNGHFPPVIDTFLHVYPDKVVEIGEWRKGALPLWNADWGCGMPQMASWQSMCFYPFAWAWGVLGNPDSLVAFCLLQDLLAFIGFALWLGSQGVKPPARWLGALSYAGSGLAVECWGYPHHSAAFAWIPWIFWACQRFLDKPRWGSWTALVLSLLLQLLAGYPIFVFYTWVLLLSWMVFQKCSLKLIRGVAGALLFSLLSASLQWLPFLELLAHSKRGGWWTEFPFFMNPWEYLALLKPDILGWPGSSSYKGNPGDFAFNPYLGLAPLGLLLVGCFFLWGKNRSFRFWATGSLFILFWMAGGHFPPWRVLTVDLLQWLEPSKAVPLFILCAATGASLAFSSLLREKQVPWRSWVLGAVGLFWIIDLLAVPFLVTRPVENPYRTEQWRSDAQKIDRLSGGGRILSLANGPFRFSGEEALEKSVEIPPEYFLADSNAVAGLRSAGYFMSINPMELENLLKYTNRGFPYLGDFLDVAGVSLFLLPQPLPAPKYRSAGKWRDDFISLDPAASKDMRFVAGERMFPDRQALLNTLARPHSGWQDRVFLERPLEDQTVQLEPPGRPLEAVGETGFGRPNNSRAAFQGDFPKPGYVVFDETFWPGWRAWVDDRPEPILRAYGLFMAVRVDKGNHQVDFRYEPTAFRLGLFISLLALAVLSLGLLKAFQESTRGVLSPGEGK